MWIVYGEVTGEGQRSGRDHISFFETHGRTATISHPQYRCRYRNTEPYWLSITESYTLPPIMWRGGTALCNASVNNNCIGRNHIPYGKASYTSTGCLLCQCMGSDRKEHSRGSESDDPYEESHRFLRFLGEVL